ncbi:dUTP diphosphatase [Oceaniovalibus guishaninsula]|nr:dUTP diphosphatase [Oceaniovalibus guishaninsula]
MREGWADPTIPLPTYATDGAAGADIRANFAAPDRGGLPIEPMARAIVPTGLRMAIPEGFEMQLRPRSGLARDHGVTLVNAPATIDADYRGAVAILLINLGQVPFVVLHGMRIAQGVIAPVVRAAFAETDRLDGTPRGTGGFGSTGTS